VVRKESHAATSASESLEGLLAQREVDAWILCLSSDDDRLRPGQAFVRLDWRFRGALSRALLSGALGSKPGEVSYLPCTRPVGDLALETFRVLTLGVRNRKEISNPELAPLLKNVNGLGLKKIGLSASDFGWTISEAKRHLSGWKGVEACVIE
jgi:hypothetical protein